MLLLVTAALKLSGTGVSALPQVGWLSAPWLQVAAAEWEIVIGLWLLSGAARRWSWLVAVATFAAFAVVSGTLGYRGVASCGCFGAVHASPWWAFGVDLAALAMLALVRPKSWRGIAVPRGVLVGGGLAAGLLAALAGGGSLLYGSPGAALAKLRGETLAFDQSYVEFGSGAAGERLTAEVRVRNLSGSPVRLVGGTSDCSCVTTSDMPVTLVGGGEQTITIRLKLPESAGAFTRTAEVWTDCDAQRSVRLTLGARVTE